MKIESTYGFILRGTLNDVEYIIRCIEENTELNVVYQKSSQDELYISKQMVYEK